jgi:hypothetical protein
MLLGVWIHDSSRKEYERRLFKNDELHEDEYSLLNYYEEKGVTKRFHY